MLEFTHDWRLVIASFAIALMAGFTGLSLTRGASRLDIPRRKAVVSMAAVALGGGIWATMKGWPDYAPVAAGMAAALPYLHLFAPAAT